MENTALQYTASNKKERLITAAEQLIHQRGFNQTTLADIARNAEVPLGNVYYYFKTKDDIARAVIEFREQHCSSLMQQWEQLSNPRERILAFLDMAESFKDHNRSNGCPVGGLCQELNKNGNKDLKKMAAASITLRLDWLAKQFQQLHQANPEKSAAHLLAVLQGGILMANTLDDEGALVGEIDYLREWVTEM